jgi:transcriptional regulator with AAA-type ATPase domain
MASKALTPADREFFRALADVGYGNPFSKPRGELIVRLAPRATDPWDLMRDPEALARVVEPRLAPWRSDGGLARLSGEDREVLRPAFLYTCFHFARAQLDAHIERQERQPGAPVPFPFADEIVAHLVKSGFPEEITARYVALLFQLRRAGYFISRSLAGRSESMRRLREALWNNIFTHDMRGFDAALWNRMEDFSTLLLGETGSGKGQAATAIGRSGFIPYLPESRRFAANFTETFISINLSQFAENLIESELFGHRKGAFTGAIDHHEGVFERCSAHGALFLDEIGEVAVPVQIKLLQVLQERTFTPVGSREKKRFSGRVIAATNRPLTDLRRQGRFREDFFYRLCSDVIEVPTLRQRLAESPVELEQLVQVLLERIAGERASVLVGQVMEALKHDLPADYAWPGNVRELEQAVRRILLTGRYKPEASAGEEADLEERFVARLREGRLSAEQLLSGYSALLYERLGSYAAVAERTGLDPRTSRKYVLSAKSG